MNEHDLADTINRGHEAFLEKLRPGKASSSFSYWLSRAAVNLCLTYESDELKGKLKHCAELYKALENGFKVIKDMWDDCSEEERDDLDSSYAFFKETFEGKAHPDSDWEKSVEKFVESMTAKKTTVVPPVDEETENSAKFCAEDFSEEERGDLDSSYALFKETFEDKPHPDPDSDSEKSVEEFVEKSMIAKKITVVAPVDEETENYEKFFVKVFSEEMKDDLDSSHDFFEGIFEGKAHPDPDWEKSVEEFVKESMTAKKTMVVSPVDEETENSDESKIDPVSEESLEVCPICKESLFKKPKVLPCSHVFCTSCLEGCMRATNKKPGDLMPCGLCRRDITIPKEGIGGLDDAEDAETLLKPAQLLLLSLISNTCEACSEDSDVDASNIPPAVIDCADCEKKLCAECQRFHQKIYKALEVKYLDDPKNISTELAQLTITKEAGKIAEVPAKYNHYPVVVQTMVTKAANDERKRIHGLTILNKELFVITAQSSCVEVYDSMQFSFSRRWSLTELINPCDIVSCSKNECLYILDSRDKILRVDPAGNLIKILSTGNKFGESLSVTHDNNIILTLYEDRKLCEYSKDGKLIHTVILPLEILNPLHAIKLPVADGDFLVSHGFHRGDLHRVCKVDKNGNLKKAFGRESGKTNQQLDCPSYLAIDKSGFVMVADQRNARVLLLDSDLQFKREIVSKWKHNCHWILRILLDESNNHLFVTENWGKGRITMFILRP